MNKIEVISKGKHGGSYRLLLNGNEVDGVLVGETDINSLIDPDEVRHIKLALVVDEFIVRPEAYDEVVVS